LLQRKTSPTHTSCSPPPSAADRAAKKKRREAFLKSYNKRTNTTSLRSLAKLHGIGLATASRLASGKTQTGSLPGRRYLLPSAVEEELVKSLLNCAKNACAVRVAQIPLIVRRIAEKMGIAIDEFVCSRPPSGQETQLT
jgi:hypothetical protein